MGLAVHALSPAPPAHRSRSERPSEVPSSHRRVRMRPSTVPPPPSSPPPSVHCVAYEQEQGDIELVAALREGRGWAADALYVRVERVVERVLLRILVRRGSDFPDLFQETFERLVRSLVEGRFEGSCSLSTWAGSIASH